MFKNLVAVLMVAGLTCNDQDLYSPTILKNILCLFLQDLHIGM